MDKFLENLKQQAEENPVFAMAAAGALMTGASKLLNAISWKQETARRMKKDRRK